MPDFRQHLMDLYRMQQFCMMHRFLQYPFIETEDYMSKKIVPYERAEAKLQELHLVDYGCGLPHGLVWLLRRQPGKIRSVALVDLDLIALEFSESLVRELAPHVELEVHPLAGTDVLPKIRADKNLVLAADVFEHLLEPEKAMRNLLASVTRSPSMAYFDLGLHNDADQHVCRDTGFLKDTVRNLGFQAMELDVWMTEFTKSN